MPLLWYPTIFEIKYNFLKFFRRNKSPSLKSIGFVSSSKSCSAKLSFSSHFFWINSSFFRSTSSLLLHSGQWISGHSKAGHVVSGHFSTGQVCSGHFRSGHWVSGQLISGHVFSGHFGLGKFSMLRLTRLFERSESQICYVFYYLIIHGKN